MTESHRIWEILEVVEHMAVSSAFRDTIKKSPSIRHALFLEPLTKITDRQLHLARTNILQSTVWDPRDNLMVGFPPANLPKTVFLNSLIQRLLEYGMHLAMQEVGPNKAVVQREYLMLSHYGMAMLLASPATASWRNMLLAQTSANPVYEVRFKVRFEDDGRRDRVIPLHNSGLAMKDLITTDELRPWRSNNSLCEGTGDWIRVGVLSLQTDVHWQIGWKRVVHLAEESHLKTDVTEWDVIYAAAAAAEAEGRRLEEADPEEFEAAQWILGEEAPLPG